MVISKSSKLAIALSTSIPCIAAITTGVVVGGYFSSKNANPYKEYYRVPATDSTQSFLAAFNSSILHNARLLVLPGFTLNPPMTEALKINKFNKTGFLLIDDTYSGSATSQVASIQYRVDEGSFITGISIAMYLNEYKEYFMNNDGKLTWATYGGLNFSSVTSFMAGFQKGIDFFNNIIRPMNNNLRKVEQISLSQGANDLNNNYAGGFGPADGNSLIDKFLVKEVDCLIPVAGPQTMSAASKIVIGNKPTIVIGVDSAVEDDRTAKTYKLPKLTLHNNPDGSKPKQPEQVIPFSSLKKIPQTIPQMVQAINHQDSFPAEIPESKIGGFGVQSLGDVYNDGVGVSKPGELYFINAMKILNPSVIDNQSALKELNKYPEFSKYFVSNSSSLIGTKTEEFFKDSFISGSSYFEYQLPINAKLYDPPPKQIPKEIESPNMSQKDWEEKLSFNLNGFIQKGAQSDSEKIKIILSTSSSILLDASFSQAAYLGVYYFLKDGYGINIPKIEG